MIVCHYHPDQPARRHCNECRVNLCQQCIKTENAIQDKYLCPVCENQTQHLGYAHAIQPFWQRLGKIIHYPFNPFTLAYLTALTLLFLLASFLPLSWLFYFIILYALVKYGFAVLEHSARGYLQPPDSGLGHIASNNWIPLQHLFVLAILGGSVAALAYYVSPGLALIWGIIVLYLLPASIMLLGVTGNIMHAIYPIALLDVVRAIGANYVLLWLFLIIIGLFDGAVAYAIHLGLPDKIGFPIAFFVSNLLSIANFHLLGYVVYQYHETLGYEVDQDFAEDEPEQPSQYSSDSIHQEIQILLSKGQYEVAKARLKKKLLSQPNNLDLHHYCHQFLVTHNDRPGIPRHAQQYLPILIASQQDKTALKVTQLCFDIREDFKLKEAETVLRLVSIALKQQQAPLALQLLTHFRAYYPGNAQIVEAQFQYAKLLHEIKHDTANAKIILRSLIGRHSTHPKIAFIKDYLTKLPGK